MKNLDLISKRILAIALSISAVLLCASLLIYTTHPAKAQAAPSFPSRMDDGRRYDAVASASPNQNGTPTFLIWNTQTGTYKVLSNAAIVSSDKFW